MDESDGQRRQGDHASFVWSASVDRSEMESNRNVRDHCCIPFEGGDACEQASEEETAQRCDREQSSELGEG